jgi:microcystin-dependent protein
MSNPFIGQMIMFGGNFAISGWALCDGQIQSIAQNNALFALIGTTYGGDGTNTFNLPDLRGRLPIHQGTGPGLSTYVIGESGGTETVLLNSAAMASHQHSLVATLNTATSNLPAGGLLATPPQPSPGETALYQSGSATTGSLVQTTGPAGGNVAHDNIMPYACVSLLIALFGVFPSRN